ncbi:MAG: thioredoxin domain-containing protein [bacterium]|nr:thioredoxin domain-containing protein [bacterium]
MDENLKDLFPEAFAPPWYKSFWKVIIVIVLAFIMIMALLFAFLVFAEYRKIQNGEISTFAVDTNTGIAPTLQKNNFIPGADDDPFIGATDAKVVVISFEDFQCPYCKESYPIIKKVVEQYPTQVKYVFRDFPLFTLHSQAKEAALAGECADEQGEFWTYHDLVFDRQSELALNDIFITLAEEAGLDVASFSECLTSERYLDEIQQDLDEGLLAGVEATPTFVVNNTIYRGILSEQQWLDIVDKELNKLP